MKEKERYEIHMYDDCNVELYDNGVLDKSITDAWEMGKLLNQQDARIKELEEALKKANTNNYLTDYYFVEKENQQLKDKLKVVDDFMHNYGYSNYDYGEILEDLQTRAFQSEDDTKIVEELLDHLNLSDENKILSTIKQSQNQKAIEELKIVLDNFKDRPTYFDVVRRELCLNDQDKQFIDFINNQIKSLKGEE